MEFENDFFHESAPEQDKRDARKISSPEKRQNSSMLRGLGCFLGIKWAAAVPIFTLFNIFPLQTYFYAKSHLLSMLKSKKSDRWRKKCNQSTPALNLHWETSWELKLFTNSYSPQKDILSILYALFSWYMPLSADILCPLYILLVFGNCIIA